MAYVIKQHNGYILKFVGDAVIGYFVEKDSGGNMADISVSCAESMLKVVKTGINPVLQQYDYQHVCCWCLFGSIFSLEKL